MSNYERMLFEQNYNHVKKLMVIYCCNTQQAEDFTQEAFYRACDVLPPPVRGGGFLGRIS
ncbi:RNA polymerase sigma factor [Dethiobacter alkaliphilus]|uniref:Uncharacterized protein n=1 Tax=Dethiobacter alkaliphilus AHT 1 TaxID=555088 RepID=C0GC72_DETAL|nr:sigma factor [Dethiobacter alkaliphilus]EEG78807.1 hypothetical protein DealDRAFT_0081 [Dethiobacter alkaliphilus AHT 1]